jgi:hypothetical protein
MLKYAKRTQFIGLITASIGYGKFLRDIRQGLTILLAKRYIFVGARGRTPTAHDMVYNLLINWRRWWWGFMGVGQ